MHLCEEQNGRCKCLFTVIQNDSLSSNVPIAVDGKQSMCQNWAIPLNSDKPACAGQAMVSRYQSEKMNVCRPTDVGGESFLVLQVWLTIMHKYKN